MIRHLPKNGSTQSEGSAEACTASLHYATGTIRTCKSRVGGGKSLNINVVSKIKDPYRGELVMQRQYLLPLGQIPAGWMVMSRQF